MTATTPPTSPADRLRASVACLPADCRNRVHLELMLRLVERESVSPAPPYDPPPARPPRPRRQSPKHPLKSALRSARRLAPELDVVDVQRCELDYVERRLT